MTTSPVPSSRTSIPAPESGWLLPGALFVVYFGWGSSYLAGRVAVDAVPPFMLAAARNLAAGLPVCAWVVLSRRWRPASGRAWLKAAVSGSLMFLGGNALLFAGMPAIGSGITAVIATTIPLWILLMVWVSDAAAAARPRELLGVGVGLTGLMLLLEPWKLSGVDRIDPIGATLVVVSAITWSLGSVLARRWQGAPSAQGMVMQQITGGAACAVVSLSLGEHASLTTAALGASILVAFAYLVIVGSMIGIAAYLWLLSHESPAKASSYAFVNPLVAVTLGWLVLGEPITARTLLAAAITIAGVALVLSTQVRRLVRRRKPGIDAERAESTTG